MTNPWNPYDTPEVSQYREKQREEYTTYVATRDLMVGNALGFRDGDPVPKSTVENPLCPWLEDGGVVKRDGKDGRAVLERTGQNTDASGDEPAKTEAAPKTTRTRSAATATGGNE